jgi:hypothetical protein
MPLEHLGSSPATSHERLFVLCRGDARVCEEESAVTGNDDRSTAAHWLEEPIRICVVKEAVLDGQVSIHAGQVSQCDLLRPAEEL